MLWWTLRQLKSNDSITRKQAAERIGDLKNVRAAKALVQALKTEKVMMVRSTLENALQKMGTASINPLLEALGDKKFDTRLRAASILGKLGTDATDPLIDALKSQNNLVREMVAFALGAIKDQCATLPLAKLLKDSEPQVRIEPAKAIGKIGDVQAVPALIEALEVEQYWVRVAAIKSLQELGWKPETDEQVAICAVSKDGVEIPANEYKDAIASGTKAVAPLIVALQTAEFNRMYGWVVQESAARALGEIGDRRALDPLRKLLSNCDWKVKEALEIAIKKIEKRWAPVELADKIISKKAIRPTDSERKKNRHGKCTTCESVVALLDAVEICWDWDGVDAYGYFCKTCYAPNDISTGSLLDKYGDPLIDQYTD